MEATEMEDYNETVVHYYYYYLFNYSDYYHGDNMEFDDFFSNIHKYTAILGAFLSVSTFLVNMLVIVSCLRDCKFKFDIFYLQIVNFSVANVLIGGFVIPLTVYYILNPWNLGSCMCTIWIISDVFLPFVSLLTLILLHLDRLVLSYRPEAYLCLFQQCLKPVLLISPWIIAFVFVVPLWTHGSLPYELRKGECVILLSKSVAFAGCIITYYAPCLCIIFVTLAVVLVRMGHRGSMVTCQHRKQSLDSLVTTSEIVAEDLVNIERKNSLSIEPVSTQSIVAVVFASFLFCSMWFPYQCTNLLISLCNSMHCMPSPMQSQVVTWASTASATIVPVAWLVDTNKRRSCERLLCGETEPEPSEEEESV